MLNLYLDVFKCLNRRKVKYVVIGGVAAVVHGVPRTTFDLDLLIEATLENATPGLRFSTAWKNRRKVRAKGTAIPLASRNDPIRSKRAAGRPIDLEDIRLLNLTMDRSQHPPSRKPRGDGQSATE